MKVTARWVVAGAMATLIGCVSGTWFDKVGYYQMKPRLEYQGFSFDRPPNRNWYLLRSEETHTSVTIRRDFRSPSQTHSFYARVGLGGITEQPETHAQFSELARIEEQKAPYEIRTVSSKQRLTTKQGQWCVRFESSHLVVGAPSAPTEELRMVLRGYRCLHPTWPKTTLDFYYSVRGLPSELNETLYEEGEAFVAGVRIDVAPNTPAGGSAAETLPAEKLRP